MSRATVLEVMGQRTITTHPVKYPWSVLFPPILIMYPLEMDSVTNPYRSESVATADGNQIEIIYYYTDKKKADSAVTDDELTPLVFEGRVLKGWGWSYLHQNEERYAIDLQVR